MYSKLKLKKFYPIINEQAFVEKWVMLNNQKEYRGISFMNYFKGQWGIFKSMFIGNDDVNEKKEKEKEEKKESNNENEKIEENKNEINIDTKKK